MTNLENINIYNLLELVYVEYNNSNGNLTYHNSFLNVLKKKHLYPLLKVKKFKNDNNLVLLHNSYFNKDNNLEYKELFDQCRSIVLDFSKSLGNNIIVSYNNSIPERITIDDYLKDNNNSTDKCYMALDGTMITVYNHNGVWHFGTTGCPDINKSKFSSPDKKHGYMFDEILYEMFKSSVDINDPDISIKLRNFLTSLLNPLYSYEFVMIHHENKHIIDYTNELGDKYKYLFHINSKNRITLQEENLENNPLVNYGIKYLSAFNTTTDAILYLNSNPNCYGIIAKRNNKLYKISSIQILENEEYNACNSNVWYNLLYVYMLNKKEFKIINFLNKYAVNYTPLYDINNVVIDPQLLIDIVMNTIKEVLYNLYISTTKYYNRYKRFKVNMDLDKTLNPVLRFHLAQLRHQQITICKNHILKKNNIFNYLCKNNNIKNIKILIKHFLTNNIYDIPEQNMYYLNIFDNVLS
jgi:hypothetical protein